MSRVLVTGATGGLGGGLPGTIDTPANRERMPAARRGIWVDPRQLGELIRFLASPESAPLTGAAILVG